MKISTLLFLLAFPFTLLAQHTITGSYSDYFGNRMYLNADSTFKYTWHFDLSSSWTKGTWRLKGDTIFFTMIPTYDTLSVTKANNRIVDSLILSEDEFPKRLTQPQSPGLFLSSYGQNYSTYPKKLAFKKGRLYGIHNGRLVTKKVRGVWSRKKRVPWYSKD